MKRTKRLPRPNRQVVRCTHPTRLQAAAQATLRRLLVVSSATAYGAWPDNPVPMDETWPLRARREFQYAADKTEVEGLVAAFAEENQEIAVSRVRPCVIGGPRMENYLKRFIFGMPFLVLLGGRNTPTQFVHEEDVVAAIDTILTHNGRGAFSLAPPRLAPAFLISARIA